MTRTTEALKRLGVVSLAAATIGTGLTVSLATPAFANHLITQVVLTPDTANAPSGTCVTYTATLNTASGRATTTAPDPTNSLDVTLTQGSTAPIAGVGGVPSPTAEFCDPTTGGLSGSNTAVFVDTDRDGIITFGVVDTGAAGNTTTVNAFVEPPASNNGVRDTNEPFDTSVQTTFRAAQANDVTAVTVFADSKTATNVVGEQHDVSVRIDSGNFAVAGITPSITVTGANTTPNSSGAAQFGATCGASDSRGIATCSYTGTNAGTDNIVIFVNQSRAGQTVTPARDAGEPGDTATKTYVTAAPAGAIVTLSCQSGTFGPNADTCFRTTTGGVTTVTATVLTGANGTPVANAVVRFSVTGGSDADTETVTPTEAQTNSAGQVVVTLNDATRTVGETLTITATLPRASGGNATDTINVTYANSASPNAARNVDLTPGTATTTAGNNQVFTARVTDANGTPVVGATVTFRSSGAGSFTGGATEFTTTTDNNGQATVTATSAANAGNGTQTITAFITQGDCAGGSGATPNATGATTTQLQCSDSSTNTITARPADNPNPNPSDTAIARITLNVTTGRITAGNAPELFGIVTLQDGSRAANRDVTILQKRYNTTSYEELQTESDVTTNANGEFRIKIRPDRQTAYVARVTGTSVQSDAANSGRRAIIVQVNNRINIAAPVGGASATNRAIQVRGDLDPNFASVRIGVAVLRNGRFTYITQGITDNNGAFVINVRNLPTGSYALVVYTSARQGTLAGSASRAINVR